MFFVSGTSRHCIDRLNQQQQQREQQQNGPERCDDDGCKSTMAFWNEWLMAVAAFVANSFERHLKEWSSFSHIVCNVLPLVRPYRCIGMLSVRPAIMACMCIYIMIYMKNMNTQGSSLCIKTWWLFQRTWFRAVFFYSSSSSFSFLSLSVSLSLFLPHSRIIYMK